ncbi:hypothetical protein H0I76_11815 [Limibaculum sp. M0105]|uniref:Lipoprotein n=1 Tax=Thermohalobaculum xanthum TaxID=2753746 RepID=A0A8J7M9G1_9RHOB|nr:hypothetical protein [Thermohalobaculum xanthum]MBK0399879.1 hypothetical protein [Thermohalobaculum xanthum]
MTDPRTIWRGFRLAITALSLSAAVVAGCSASASAESATGSAAPGVGLLFDAHQLDGLADGTALHYAHAREVAPGSPAPAVEDGALRLALGASESEVTLVEGTRTRRLDPFPRASGNPVFIVFLESMLRAVAAQTGGSPFYLRNRIKEALWKGAVATPVSVRLGDAEVAAERLSYQPFAADSHKAELGELAGLTIEFVLAEGAPGRFVSLTAATPDGGATPFREEIRLIGETLE